MKLKEIIQTIVHVDNVEEVLVKNENPAYKQFNVIAFFISGFVAYYLYTYIQGTRDWGQIQGSLTISGIIRVNGTNGGAI